MEYSIFFTIGVVALLAAMSPGPDFIVVVKNSLGGSRVLGMATALGVSLGILTHVFYSLIGVGFVIAQSILLFNLIKYIGAAYLIYMAIQLLLVKRDGFVGSESNKDVLSVNVLGGFKEGFFTNSLNPKATLFFLSLFTVVLDPQTSIMVQVLIGLEVAVIVGLWFVCLSLFITHKKTRGIFDKISYYLMKLMGVTLAGLGVKLALEKN